MKLEELDGAGLQRLAPRIEDIRHDLGKYIVFEQRFAGEEGDRAAAVRADVGATYQAGSDRLAAWELWARLRPADLDDDPDIAAIDRATEALRSIDLGTDAGIARAAELAHEVSECTRSLARRLHGLLEPID